MKITVKQIATIFLMFLLIGFLLEKAWIVLLLLHGKKVELMENNMVILVAEFGFLFMCAWIAIVVLALMFERPNPKN